MGSEPVVERPRRVRLREVDLREIDVAPGMVRVRSQQKSSLRGDFDDGPIRPLKSIQSSQRRDGASNEVYRVQESLGHNNRIVDGRGWGMSGRHFPEQEHFHESIRWCRPTGQITRIEAVARRTSGHGADGRLDGVEAPGRLVTCAQINQ